MVDEHTTGPEPKAIGTRLVVSNDRLQILLEWEPAQDTVELLRSSLGDMWSALGVAIPFSLEALTAALKEAATSSVEPGARVRTVLACGTPPQPSVNGWIEWGGPYFESGFSVDAVDGSVNYRRPAARTTVAGGERLARVHPPVSGTAGVDVYGKAIPVAGAIAARLERGDNVTVSESGNEFFALRDGHIRLAGLRLHVDETYSLQNVGLKSGDIDHPGALEVTGDVEPDAHIRTKGNIFIAGMIEDAKIDCGGDLTVGGGIVGGEGKHIRVAGCLHAKYINHAAIHVGQDLVVERDIDQCDVECGGLVAVPEGRIVGGNVAAYGGILVGEAGSHGNVPTHFSVGEDPALHERLHAKHVEIAELAREMAHLMEPLERLRPYESRLDPRQHAQLDMLRDRLQAITGQHEAAEREAHAIVREHGRPHGRVEVRKAIHGDVIISMGGFQLRVEDTLQGPLQTALTDEGIVLEAATHPHGHSAHARH